MYLSGIDRLVAADYEHYEVSNFARPAHRCRHNEVYWTGGSYDAVGPGAARYRNGCRETNHRSTTTYIRRMLGGKSVVSNREFLLPEQRARELLVLGLRRLEGVGRDEFFGRTGFNLDALAGIAVAEHVAAGRFVDDGQRVRLSPSGLVVSDAIWPDLL